MTYYLFVTYNTHSLTCLFNQTQDKFLLLTGTVCIELVQKIEMLVTPQTTTTTTVW